MKNILLLLLGINVATPLAVLAFRYLFKKGIEFDHIFMFSVGFIFYWILPVGIGLFKFYIGADSMFSWYQIFQGIKNESLIAYLLCSFACYLFFVAGGTIGNRVFGSSSSKILHITYDSRLLYLFLFIGIAITGIFAFSLRHLFFTGYSVSPWSTWKGSFTAGSIFLFSLAFVYGFRLQEESSTRLTFFQTTKNWYFFVSLLCAVLLVSLGGKMFFVSWIFMILTYRSVFFQSFRFRTLVIMFAAIAISSTFFTVFRTGDMQAFSIFVQRLFKNDYFIYLFLSDTLFASFNLIYFLQEQMLPILGFPAFLLCDFTRIIPTFIFPGKALFQLNPGDFGYTIFYSGGALNSFFSLMINFGIIGSILFLFSFSFLLQFLRVSPIMRPFRSIYCLITSFLAICFFRDFNATMVKLIFEFSILLPVIVIFMSHIISSTVRSIGTNEK